MHAHYLKPLAFFLRDHVEPERFLFSRFVGYGWAGDQTLSCGVSACAMGWAPQVPELRPLGLRYMLLRYVPTKGWVEMPFGATDSMVHIVNEAVIKRLRRMGCAILPSIVTAMDVFDLTEDEAHYLFMPSCGPDRSIVEHSGLGRDASAKEVAEHILAFIERGGVPPLPPSPPRFPTLLGQ